MQGAHSRKKTVPTPYFSYYRNQCMNLRNYHPEEICKAMWIAPDQLWRYKDIGYNHFKILDRMAQTDWIIRATKAYIAEKPYPHLERILGTYGRRHTEGFLEPLKGSDPSYPIRKLEYVPQIQSPGLRGIDIVKYWSSEDHPQDCNHCRACYALFERTVVFPEKAREIAIKRNYEWQSRITKISFIESLSETLTQRITYV